MSVEPGHFVSSGSSFPVVLVGSARLVYPQKRECERDVHYEEVPIPAVAHMDLLDDGWSEQRPRRHGRPKRLGGLATQDIYRSANNRHGVHGHTATEIPT